MCASCGATAEGNTNDGSGRGNTNDGSGRGNGTEAAAENLLNQPEWRVS